MPCYCIFLWATSGNPVFFVAFSQLHVMNLVQTARLHKILNKGSREAPPNSLSIVQAKGKIRGMRTGTGKNSFCTSPTLNVSGEREAWYKPKWDEATPNLWICHPSVDSYRVVMTLCAGELLANSKTFTKYWSTWNLKLVTISWFKIFAHKLIPWHSKQIGLFSRALLQEDTKRVPPTDMMPKISYFSLIFNKWIISTVLLATILPLMAKDITNCKTLNSNMSALNKTRPRDKWWSLQPPVYSQGHVPYLEQIVLGQESTRCKSAFLKASAKTHARLQHWTADALFEKFRINWVSQFETQTLSPSPGKIDDDARTAQNTELKISEIYRQPS